MIEKINLASDLSLIVLSAAGKENTDNIKSLINQTVFTNKINNNQIVELVILDLFAASRAIDATLEKNIAKEINDMLHELVSVAISKNYEISETNVQDLILKRYSEFYPILSKNNDSNLMAFNFGLNFANIFFSKVITENDKGALAFIFGISDMFVSTIENIEEFIKNKLKD